jgi:membrane protein implicated in regulation of membrane protease activity
MAARALDLPLGLFGILFIGGFVALSLGLALALRPFVRRRFGDEHNAVFDTGFSAVGTMYAIVAGLLVLGVYSTFDDASKASADEASNLVLMYQQTRAFPQPERDQARQAIVSYTRSVIEDEWPALANGNGSPKTDQALNTMFDVWAPMDPSGQWSDEYSASVDQMNTVLTLRNERIDDSGAALNPIYWVMLFVGAFLTILHLALLRMENRTMHLIAVGVTAAMLGLVLYLLIEVNLPFRGDISLSPDNFRTALATMTTINH